MSYTFICPQCGATGDDLILNGEGWWLASEQRWIFDADDYSNWYCLKCEDQVEANEVPYTPAGARER